MAVSMPALSTAALDTTNLRAPSLGDARKAKARQQSQDFEAVFLNSMFQQMFTDVNGEGPFGGTPGTGVWRSFLTDEFSKNFAKAGGIGLSDRIYDSLLAAQEARDKK